MKKKPFKDSDEYSGTRLPAGRDMVSISDQYGIKVALLEIPRILDQQDISEIRKKLSAMTREGQASSGFVIDFRKVINMSSSALGMLITIHKRICETGGKLHLCNINDTIMDLFHITRLDKILNIDDSLEQSLSSISESFNT